MKRTFTTIVLSLSLLTVVFSMSENPSSETKKNLFNGFVITNQGDTLRGKIKYVNPVYNELKVRFYNENGKKTTYKPSDLVEYAFEVNEYSRTQKKRVKHWVHYYRKAIKRNPLKKGDGLSIVFLHRITTGEINLYSYYVLESSRINHRDYDERYFAERVTPSGGFELTYIHKGNFREISQELLGNNERLAGKLGTNGFGYKYMAKVVRIHNKMADGEDVKL